MISFSFSLFLSLSLFLLFCNTQSQLKIIFQATYYNKFYILSSNIYFSIIQYSAQIPQFAKITIIYYI